MLRYHQFWTGCAFIRQTRTKNHTKYASTWKSIRFKMLQSNVRYICAHRLCANFIKQFTNVGSSRPCMQHVNRNDIFCHQFVLCNYLPVYIKWSTVDTEFSTFLVVCCYWIINFAECTRGRRFQSFSAYRVNQFQQYLFHRSICSMRIWKSVWLFCWVFAWLLFQQLINNWKVIMWRYIQT